MQLDKVVPLLRLYRRNSEDPLQLLLDYAIHSVLFISSVLNRVPMQIVCSAVQMIIDEKDQ